jgi:7-cyano-7-deazaguanine reductase
VTGYSDEHAALGVDATLPAIETWANQYEGREYSVEIRCPEFTSVCPKTGLPDFATLVVTYVPGKLCLELKSFKLYLLEYRDLGIFQENVVNKVLDDVVAAARPIRARVEGRFAARGGITTVVEAAYPT